MESEKSPVDRARRLVELLATYDPLPECRMDFERAAGAPPRYALIQRSTGDGDIHWLTLCATRQEVLDYWLTELDPYDWVPRAVVDLDTGLEVPFYVRMSFAPIATSAAEPAPEAP